ncbi:MAG: hypothetical protein AAGA23_21650 [Pseudomonadota bacterium]
MKHLIQSKFFAQVTLLAVAITAPAAWAQSPQVINIPLSYPDRPMTLEVGILSAEIEVIGEDRSDVELEVSAISSSRKIITPSGAMPITTSGFALEADEDENRVEVSTDWRNEKMKFLARVPRNASLELSTVNDGIIVVRNVHGDMDLRNVNGPITATGIVGSVAAESVNENIKIYFDEFGADATATLTTINGNLDVGIPDGTGAEFHLDTGRGNINTDFEVTVESRKPIIERKDHEKGVKVKVETVITAVVGDGGPIVRMKSLNGNLRISKSN